jgi:murein DD-endopeptidase MepM/ murein hydrolase activator NlpD
MKYTYQLLIFTLIIPAVVFGYSAIKAIGQINDVYADRESAEINREVKQINNDIQDKKLEIKRIQQKQEKYTEEIRQKQQEKSSLNNQLAILDNRVAKAELDLELAQTEIERISLEIKKTDQEIESKSSSIESEKNKIANTLRLINKRGNTSSLEIILLNDSLSEFMNQVKYLEDINNGIKDSLENLKELKRLLDRDRAELEKQNSDFAKLKDDLQAKKDSLEAEKESKLMIIAQLTTSEKQYQNLLELSKKEQQDAASEIVSMEKIAREKLASLEGKKLEFNDSGMAWPVEKNKVTAFFRDPDYPFKHIFEHAAIDIRAAQGSTLKAAASGYVAKVKNGGATGYSYIMIIHGNGLSTVYGHVSKILVAEDEYVVQGQTIGRTGGLPGTPGAGRLTTGPHLHFEVRLNGIPVDPLAHLP